MPIDLVIEEGQRYKHRYSGKIVEIVKVYRTEPRQRSSCIVRGSRSRDGRSRIWHIQSDTLARQYRLNRPAPELERSGTDEA